MKKAPTLIARAVANLKNQNLKGSFKIKKKKVRQLLKSDPIHKNSKVSKMHILKSCFFNSLILNSLLLK